MLCKLFLNCLICSLGQHFTDIKGSMYMLVHCLASKYARFVVLGRLMYWTPPPLIEPLDPPLLKSDDFFREPKDIGPPPFKTPGHAPGVRLTLLLILTSQRYSELGYKVHSTKFQQ